MEESYVLYKEEDDPLEYVSAHPSPRDFKPTVYHLKLPDGVVLELPPGSQMTVFEGIDLNHTILKIQSDVWTGELIGNKFDLMGAREREG